MAEFFTLIPDRPLMAEQMCLQNVTYFSCYLFLGCGQKSLLERTITCKINLIPILQKLVKSCAEKHSFYISHDLIKRQPLILIHSKFQ